MECLKSPKKAQNSRIGAARFITLKCQRYNKVKHYTHSEGLYNNPYRSSREILSDYIREASASHQYRPELFTLATSDQGQHLIYDNKEVMAYTIIRT